VLAALTVGVGFAAPAAGSTRSAPRARASAAGTLLRAREILAPRGARAWRILYRSTTGSGQPVDVSGLVVAPTGRAPLGGRNVVAWAHGTTGFTTECAPSDVADPAVNLVNYFSYQSPYGFDAGVPALTTFLRAGDVVVATDYQGLGTPGKHQYTVGGTEAHNVSDSVRAAEQLRAASAGDRAVVLGWSQGGGAALWVGQDTSYAPEVEVLGSAALAPNADLYNQFIGVVRPGPTDATAPSHLAALRITAYLGMQAAYPGLRLSDVLQPPGLVAAGGAHHQCIEHLADTVLQTSINNGWGLDPTNHFFRPILPPKPWRHAFKVNTPGYAPAAAPVLVMQGTADTVIDPYSTAQYIKRACSFTQPVMYTTYANQTHQTIPAAAESQYVRWIADRFASRPAPSNCPGR
jgi:pimeloyl-ACP methyl ester carboxylesterase